MPYELFCFVDFDGDNKFEGFLSYFKKENKFGEKLGETTKFELNNPAPNFYLNNLKLKKSLFDQIERKIFLESVNPLKGQLIFKGYPNEDSKIEFEGVKIGEVLFLGEMSFEVISLSRDSIRYRVLTPFKTWAKISDDKTVLKTGNVFLLLNEFKFFTEPF